MSALTLKLGSCLEDPRCLHKNFNGQFITTPATVFQPCSIESPVFILDWDASYAGCNYLYVQDWSRYYYIRSVTTLNGGRAQISCDEDYLNSFAEEIGDITCSLYKQQDYENKATLFYKDPDMIPRQDTVTFTQTWDMGSYVWDTANIYLTTIG